MMHEFKIMFLMRFTILIILVFFSNCYSQQTVQIDKKYTFLNVDTDKTKYRYIIDEVQSEKLLCAKDYFKFNDDKNTISFNNIDIASNMLIAKYLLCTQIICYFSKIDLYITQKNILIIKTETKTETLDDLKNNQNVVEKIYKKLEKKYQKIEKCFYNIKNIFSIYNWYNNKLTPICVDKNINICINNIESLQKKLLKFTEYGKLFITYCNKKKYAVNAKKCLNKVNIELNNKIENRYDCNMVKFLLLKKNDLEKILFN